MSDFKASNSISAGAVPQTALTAQPQPLHVCKGPTAKERGGRGEEEVAVISVLSWQT